MKYLIVYIIGVVFTGFTTLIVNALEINIAVALMIGFVFTFALGQITI